MKFPVMNKRPRQAVVVPELNGGLNLRDSVSMINDNQLIDCKNVWFSDGALKTRPGISETHFFNNENQSGEFRAHDVYTVVDGENCRLFSQINENVGKINFYWIGKTILETLPSISDFLGTYLLVQIDNIIYAFFSEGFRLLKYNIIENSKSWKNVETNEMYSPIITINNLPLNEDDSNPSEPTQLEGYNMISNYYTMKFSTVNRNLSSNKMRYKLLHEINDHNGEWDLKGDTITARIDYGNRVAIHSIEITGSQWGEEEENYNSVDGLKMKIEGSTLVFYHQQKETEIATVSKKDFILNNMTVTAPYHRTNKEAIEAGVYPFSVEDKRKKVFKMSHCIWFGGDSAGINGGTRLFLGGNTEERNLVIWSDLNNPLYFPENNYFYVGESSSAVTAFGKQSDMLVIFKDDETYFTQYNRNSGITANDLIDQTVVDYVTSSVYFPLVLINANIGCDCPDSVQLCRNRLIWANSSGKVYTLVSNNQYSERNIFEISEMVDKRLKTERNLKKAHSSDWNGYYLLQVGRNVYALDYNSYGYQYVSSYSKTEDANIRIPWYYWEFVLSHGTSTPSIIATIDNDLKIINSGGYGIFVGEISENSMYDNMLFSADTTANYGTIEKPIESYVSTKLFEFGAQGYRKNVDKVILSLGNNGGEPIKVEYITDEGTEEEYITLEAEVTDSNSPGYIKSVPLNPCIRSVERFGVKLSCEGPLVVDGITLFYRILGGVK